MGRLEGRHCYSGACVKFNLKAVCHRTYYARLSLRETACLVSQCCAFLTQTVSVCGDDEAISTVWPLVSYLNSMVSFYLYLFRRLLCSLCEMKALYAAARFAVGSADRLLAVFFRRAGFYPAIFCQPKDKLTNISVDCVVSMPYRSVRNRKYYACNSEQLKARSISCC